MTTRSLYIALFASLAVNLFAIGAVVGGFAMVHRLGPSSHPPAGGMGQGPLWAAADSLPADQAMTYRRLLREQAQGLSQQVRAARQARREAWLSLTTEPFNAAVVTQSLAQARSLEMQARSDVEQTIVDFAAKLTPDQRAKLADGLAKTGPKGRFENHNPFGRLQEPPGSPPPP